MITPRYSKRCYEDVARILSRDARTVEIVTEDIARDFADLFAADNPTQCTGDCGEHEGATRFCEVPGMEHDFQDGFDREWFLKACGLES